MRSDNVKRHMQVSVDKVVDPVEESSRVKQKREEVTGEVQATIDEETLEQSALKIQREYEEKIALGKALYKIVNEGEVQEESFPPQWQNALDLYLKQGHQINHETAVSKFR